MARSPGQTLGLLIGTGYPWRGPMLPSTRPAFVRRTVLHNPMSNENVIRIGKLGWETSTHCTQKKSSPSTHGGQVRGILGIGLQITRRHHQVRPSMERGEHRAERGAQRNTTLNQTQMQSGGPHLPAQDMPSEDAL